MICRIGSFKIEVTNAKEIEEKLSLPFAKIDRINNNPYHQDLGGYEEEFTINGEAIKERVGFLIELEELAKEKKPVRFTTINYSFNVLITSINKNKRVFLRGAFLIQEFSITLKRYYGWKLI